MATSSIFRSRLYVGTLVLLSVIILLHIVLPGDLKQRQEVVKKSLGVLLPFSTIDVDFVQENLQDFDQDDPQLIEYVRIRHLTPPSKLPYHLDQVIKNSSVDYKNHHNQWVAEFFQNKTNGIFIEAGAAEGEFGSHTLYLERTLGWTGLLIECNPTVVPYLKTHHRKAWIADICLSLTTSPGYLNFSNPVGWTDSGTFRKPWKVPVKHVWKFFDVQTFPFYTVLAALGWTEIDYFSFDIEGVELSILKTIPFDIITFKVIIVEVMFYTKSEKRELDELLKNNNYQNVKKMKYDWIYIHESVKHLLPE